MLCSVSQDPKVRNAVVCYKHLVQIESGVYRVMARVALILKSWSAYISVVIVSRRNAHTWNRLRIWDIVISEDNEALKMSYS